MAAVGTSVSVTTTATLLSGSETDSLAGQSILFIAPSVVYLGGSGVTSGTGYPVTPGVEYSFDLQAGEAMYAIAASGTVVVPVLRTGV